MHSMIPLLCAGAIQGLVTALTEPAKIRLAATPSGRFGAVGAMKEAFESGAPCDVMILTDRMVRDMAAAGALLPHTIRPIGCVRTGVAVRSDQPTPEISSDQALRAALLAADRVYFPDAVRSTAGIHVAGMIRALGLEDALQARVHTFPNGATAMRELAASTDAAPIGITQISEILFTEGVRLIGPLPARFELSTVYTAAVSARAAHPERARGFIELLCEPAQSEARHRCGIEAIVP